MENGFYYALGFLLSTLFSVVFDLHYRYRVSKCVYRIQKNTFFLCAPVANFFPLMRKGLLKRGRTFKGGRLLKGG